MKRYKPHRSPNAYDQLFHLLAILLRLRTTPSVPYFTIATILLNTFPIEIHRLFNDTVPYDIQPPFSENNIKDQLAEYLEETYKYAERWGNKTWDQALEFEAERVWYVLRCVGLVGRGFEVCLEQEVRARVKWAREGDWKAGSEPLGPSFQSSDYGLDWVGKGREDSRRELGPVEMNAEPILGLIGGRYEMGAEAIWGSLAGRYGLSGCAEDGKVVESPKIQPLLRLRRYTIPGDKFKKALVAREQKIHPCWKSFGEQLEEIRMLEEGLKGKLCIDTDRGCVNSAERVRDPNVLS